MLDCLQIRKLIFDYDHEIATGNPILLVIDRLLIYATSCISCDAPQDIQNVVHDTYNDEAATIAKYMLWVHYCDAAELGGNIVIIFFFTVSMWSSIVSM